MSKDRKKVYLTLIRDGFTGVSYDDIKHDILLCRGKTTNKYGIYVLKSGKLLYVGSKNKYALDLEEDYYLGYNLIEINKYIHENNINTLNELVLHLYSDINKGIVAI